MSGIGEMRLLYPGMLAAELEAARRDLQACTEARTAQAKRIEKLEAALVPFRHLRVVIEEGVGDLDIVDLIGYRIVTIGYARNREIADTFNAWFERVRVALEYTGIPKAKS